MKTNKDIEPTGELCLGVDVARFGSDSSAVCWRRGRVIEKIEKRRGLSVTECAGWVDSLIRKEKPARVAIDIGGVGAGVYDILIEKHADADVLVGVNFGSAPSMPAPLGEDGKPAGGPANRRSEIWLNAKKALQTGRVRLPDDQALLAELTAPLYKFDSQGRILLESKIDMRKRGVPSPDSGDALCLTFYEPLGVPIKKKPRVELQPNNRLSGIVVTGNRMINYIVVGVARQTERNPEGLAAAGWYIVKGDQVILVSEDGEELDHAATLTPNVDARTAAARLVRNKWMDERAESLDGFGRGEALEYERWRF